MSKMLYHDEAFNGVDALSLLQNPRLTPFFPGNFGRESGWMYILAPFVAVFGAHPFALRLAATMVGILTLPAIYVLGREILGRRGAIWTTAVLAVLYWHVHLSHMALRGVLVPLVGSLAFVSLLAAHRTHHRSRWIAGGFALGLMAYTYFSARTWIALGLSLLAGLALFDIKSRKGSLMSLLIALAISLPMLLYTSSHPQESLNRFDEVGVHDVTDILNNAHLWANAWFLTGDRQVISNLPGRPILDPFLGVLFLMGIVAVPFCVKRRWYTALVVGLAITAVAPSLLSDAAPHFLRAFGLTLPIALIAGAGALLVERSARKLFGKTLAPLLPIGLLAAGGILSYQDFHTRWLQDPAVSIYMEEYINQPVDYLKSTTPTDVPVYFMPHSISHPLIIFRSAYLAPRQVGAFDTYHCTVIADVPAAYVSIARFTPDFRESLSRWADTRTLIQGPTLPQQDASLDDVFGAINPAYRTPPKLADPSAPIPLYVVYQAVPRPDFLEHTSQPAIVFGSAVQVRRLAAVSPLVKSGETILIQLGFKAQRSLSGGYSAFVHLYGDPTPYEGGPLWSQSDEPMCASYPIDAWKSNETIVQDFELRLAADIPPGQYRIAVGVYDSATGARLPITSHSSQPGDYFVLQNISIAQR